MTKNNTLVKNASILMIASIISRVIGLIYRRPLGAILGSVGLGYYGFASNLYAVLLLISSYSIPMAVSKIVSEKLAKKEYRNAGIAFRGSLIYALVVGGAAAFVCLIFGGWLLPSNQQNALPALRALSPTILLSAILGVLRGYFQAHRSMGSTSISQIFEQIANAIVSVLAAWILAKSFAGGEGEKAAVYGAVGGTIGTGAGVLIGLAFMLFVYMVNRSYFKRRETRDKTTVTESYPEVFRLLFFLMTPIILTTFLNNAGVYLEGYIFSALQGWHGIADTAISAAYGEYSNYYIPLVGIPLALASASASAMMPELSAAYATRNYEKGNHKAQQTIRLTMFISIPSMIGLTLLAYPIMGLLFPAASPVAAKLLFFGSAQIIFASLTVIVNSALQSINHQKAAMINAGISLAACLILEAVLLFFFQKMDIYAVMLSGIFFPVLNAILSLSSMRRVMGFHLEWRRNFGEPLAAAACMGFVTFLLYNLTFNLIRRPFFVLLITIPISGLIYLIAYVLISGIREKEILYFPMGRKLAAVLRFFHVYRKP